MEYSETPPRDPEDHFAIDSTIDQWLSLLMLREDLKLRITNHDYETEREEEIAQYDVDELTVAMKETIQDFYQFLFRNF